MLLYTQEQAKYNEIRHERSVNHKRSYERKREKFAMYTPAQVSEMLRIPPSTLRRYSVLFATHLSPQAPGRKRAYSESDIATLSKVKELIRKFPLEEISARLPVMDEPPAPESTLVLIPALAKELQRLDTERQALSSELTEMKASFQAVNEKLEKLSAWLAQPWYKRLFSKPPL